MSASTNTNTLVPVDKFLSKANRRLYRHGRNYQVKIDADATISQTVQVWALADTWMNHRAFKNAYQAYMDNSKDEMEALKGKSIARWQDFRTQDGVAAGEVDPVMYSPALAPISLTVGEFANSVVHDKTGTLREFSWGPGGAAGYGILEEYDKAGNAQPSPDTTTGDMPYDDLMADNDAAQANALQTRGNLPPYDANNVGGANPWVLVGKLSGTPNAQKLSTGYFDAPCGFVILSVFGVGDPVQTSVLSMTVKSGDYKGVHAPSMIDDVRQPKHAMFGKGVPWSKN